MKIGLVQYDGEEVLVNWGSASYAEPDGNGGSLIHFRGDNAVLKVTCSVREICALLDEAEEKKAELYAVTVSLKNTDDDRALPREQRDKRSEFWHKTYLEAFLECMNASPNKENMEAYAKFATLFADFTLKEMIARELV